MVLKFPVCPFHQNILFDFRHMKNPLYGQCLNDFNIWWYSNEVRHKYNNLSDAYKFQFTSLAPSVKCAVIIDFLEIHHIHVNYEQWDMQTYFRYTIRSFPERIKENGFVLRKDRIAVLEEGIIRSVDIYNQRAIQLLLPGDHYPTPDDRRASPVHDLS